MGWALKLASAKHVYTVTVALCLLHLAWRSQDASAPVTLSNLSLTDWGVSPRDKSRALKELEGLGLITTERCKRKSPHVTLIR